MFPFNFSKFGSEPALIEAKSERSWNYLELQAEVDAMAERLPSQRTLAFCFCRNDAASVIAYLACLRRGHPVVLLDAAAQNENKHRLLKVYRPGLVFDGQWRLIPQTGARLRPELGLLLATSGTTGSPKLVRLSRNNLRSNAESIAKCLGLGPGERAAASLPIHYSYGLSVVNSHLFSGGTVVLLEDSIMQGALWSNFRKHGCTSLAGVPYMYQMLARIGFDTFDLPTLRSLTQAGGRLSNDLIVKFDAVMKSRGGKLFVMYGQTEATARIACLPPENLPAKAGCVGLPIPGGTVKIENGEIVYSGPNVMLGYAEKPADLERGDELRGVLRTGDLGEVDEDGMLFVTGRLSRFCKLYGLRINLDEIESRLKKSGPTAVRATDEKIVIFCENGGDAEHSLLRQELASAYRLNVNSFEFRKVGALPLKASGKIDYGQLAL